VRGDECVACIAPPPRTAPPQAQAHNFAKAIRTDIIYHPAIAMLVSQPNERIIPMAAFTNSSHTYPIPTATRLTFKFAIHTQLTTASCRAPWLMSHLGAIDEPGMTMVAEKGHRVVDTGRSV
jgi:hypothetical protein